MDGLDAPVKARYEFVSDERYWRRLAIAVWTHTLRRDVWVAGINFLIGGVLLSAGLPAGQPLAWGVGTVFVALSVLGPLVAWLSVRRAAKRTAIAWKKIWTEFADERFTIGTSEAVSEIKYSAYRFDRVWRGFVILRDARAPKRPLFFPAVLFPLEVLPRFGTPIRGRAFN